MPDIRTLAQGLVHDKLAFAGWHCQKRQQLFQGAPVEILGETQAVAVNFQGSNGLLKCFLVVFTDTHYLTHGPHLGTQNVPGAVKLFKGPAGKLYHHVIPRRGVLGKGAAPPIGNLIQGQASRQHGRNHSNGETGGFGSQGGGTGCAGINFNDNYPVRFRVVGELDIGSPYHINGLYHGIGIFLQPLLQFRAYGQHGGSAKGIAGMHTHGVNVLDITNGDHLVFGVPYHFQLQFFPAEDRFFH
ncbi:MAG: hypothetical protein BWY80_01130 [Firmicutes bacterium ADurb.Bin456]|nr:MAG: hypothetical protein BWY80_01130 [Firmicutes bacterium ADurb.Bin456]